MESMKATDKDRKEMWSELTLKKLPKIETLKIVNYLETPSMMHSLIKNGNTFHVTHDKPNYLVPNLLGAIKTATRLKNKMEEDNNKINRLRMVQSTSQCKKPPSFITKIRMSCLVVDLLEWNEMESKQEPFDTFLSVLDQAPIESLENKFRHVDLVIDRIKYLGLGPKFRVSKSKLEGKIEKSIYDLTKGGNDCKSLKNLLAVKAIKSQPRLREFVKEEIRERESQGPRPYPLYRTRPIRERKCKKMHI